MSNKKKYGQFYTTNCDYILKGIEIPVGTKLIEPFVGQGDLVRWSSRDEWEVYDIDPKCKAETRDTLLNPPSYEGKFVITNPPFLARNKSKDKKIFDKYKVRDLYKASIKSFVEGGVDGGILIIPFNFFCDTDSKIRSLFFENYSISKVRVFEESVFDDTDVNVCSFKFEKKKFSGKIEFTFLPEDVSFTYELKEEHGYKIAGEEFSNLESSEYRWGRLLKGQTPSTSLYLRAIDTGSEDGKIEMLVGSCEKRKSELEKKILDEINTKYRGTIKDISIEIDDYFYDTTEKSSERSFATITCNKKIEDEHLVAKMFNEELNSLREKYRSVFLTNFRNSTKSYARKRISFDQAYILLDKIMHKLLDKEV